MSEDLEAVVRHYEGIREEERITAGLGQLEFLRTQEIVRRHLPAAPARVLDVGGATGVHASWLVDDGYTVHVVDLTPRHVEVLRAELGGRGVTAEIGDARQLRVADSTFDAALLLGPLYHLTERAGRVQALAEARRAVRPGGVVVAAAINRFASLFDGLARGFLFDPEFRTVVAGDLKNGQHRNPEDRPHWFTTAYFHHPAELAVEAEDAGLMVLEVVGVEGLAGWMGHLVDRWGTERGKDAILYAARAVEREPSLLGLSAHLLVATRVAE